MSINYNTGMVYTHLFMHFLFRLHWYKLWHNTYFMLNGLYFRFNQYVIHLGVHCYNSQAAYDISNIACPDFGYWLFYIFRYTLGIGDGSWSSIHSGD